VADRTDGPAPRRRRWSRGSLVAVCVVGAIAVIAIATIHPWWGSPGALPQFTLQTLAISFAGNGSAAVKATNVCAGHCPITLSEGQRQTLSFTVNPVPPLAVCNPSKYYTVKSVVETSAGAFGLTGVTAGTSGSPLPITIPDPVGGPTCQETAQIWLSFLVGNSGPPHQTPALKVTVTLS